MASVDEQPDAGIPDTFMKVREVAEIFDVTTATVRVWLNDGTLTGQKIGKGHYWRVSARSVKQLANARYGMESQHE